MIPQEQLNKLASKLYEDIGSAKVYLDDSTSFDGVINKKIVEDNVVKVFITLSDWTGKIIKIEVFDTDGDLLQVQDFNVVKSSEFKFLAVVEIRVENEVIY